MEKKRSLSDGGFAAAITGVYALINGAFLIFHEPWRDEAQAWLITRDLSFGGMITQNRLEGSPIIWDIVLFPFVKLGLPYPFIGLISLAICAAAVYLLTRYAPLPRWAKCCAVLSGLTMYFMPVIARTYAMIPIALIFVSLCYPKRHHRPILYAFSLVLLLQTQIIMAGIAGMLMLFFLLEELGIIRKQKDGRLIHVFSISLLFLGGLFLIWSMYPSLTANQFTSSVPLFRSGFKETIYDLCIEYTRTIILVTNADFLNYNDPSRRISLLLTAVTAALILIWSRKHRKPAWALAGGLIYQTFLYTFVYIANKQRAMTSIGIVLICILMAAYDDMERSNMTDQPHMPGRSRCLYVPALCIVALLSVSGWLPDCRMDIAGNYSDSKDAATYIRQQLPQDALIVGDDESWTSAVAAYFPKGKFYNLKRGSEQVFVSWDGIFLTPYSLAEIVAHAPEVPGYGERPIYALICRTTDESPGATLVTTFQSGPPSTESYRLYFLND